MSRAWALVAPREPLHLLERALPDPAPGEVRLRIEACGLGLADWNVASLDALPRTPMLLGQEAVGVVEALGEGVDLQLGARVAVTPLATSCAACPVCERGLSQYCPRATLHAFHRDGALATHGLFAAQHLAPVPASLSSASGAVLAGSGWHALGALRTGGVGAGQRVAVYGCGGVGHLVVQLARHFGAEVRVVEPDAQRRALALTLGAQPLGPTDDVDLAIVCTPSTQAISSAARALRKTGVMVLAASTPAGRFDLSVADVVTRGVSVRGSFLGSRSELLDVLELGARGAITPHLTEHPATDVIDRLWALRDGGFVGRMVFRL